MPDSTKCKSMGVQDYLYPLNNNRGTIIRSIWRVVPGINVPYKSRNDVKIWNDPVGERTIPTLSHEIRFSGGLGGSSRADSRVKIDPQRLWGFVHRNVLQMGIAHFLPGLASKAPFLTGTFHPAICETLPLRPQTGHAMATRTFLDPSRVYRRPAPGSTIRQIKYMKCPVVKPAKPTVIEFRNNLIVRPIWNVWYRRAPFLTAGSLPVVIELTHPGQLSERHTEELQTGHPAILSWCHSWQHNAAAKTFLCWEVTSENRKKWISHLFHCVTIGLACTRVCAGACYIKRFIITQQQMYIHGSTLYYREKIFLCKKQLIKLWKSVKGRFVLIVVEKLAPVIQLFNYEILPA